MEILDELIFAFEDAINKLPILVEGCKCDYPIKSLIGIRKLVEIEDNPPIQNVIDSGVVEEIIKLLQKNNYNFEMLLSGYIRELNFDPMRIPIDIIKEIDNKIHEMSQIDDELQKEARWILTWIALGTQEQTQYVANQNVIAILVNELNAPTSNYVKISSIHALSNIMLYDTKYRDLVLENNVIEKCLQIIESITIQRIVGMKYKILLIYWDVYHRLSGFDNGQQMAYLIDNQLVQCLCDFLRKIEKEEDLSAGLYGIENILKSWFENVCDLFEEYGGNEYLNQLESDESYKEICSS